MTIGDGAAAAPARPHDAPAAAPPSGASRAGESASALFMEGKYLAALEQRLRDYHQASGDQRDFLADAVAYDYAFVGDVPNALKWLDQPGEAGVATHAAPAPPSPGLQDAVRKDALASIVEAARSRQIVILNEAHNCTQDRVFGLKVAQALKPLGFQCFAAETFSSDVVGRKYPSRSLGYYTNDPVFADFARKAMKSGYRLVPYEINPGTVSPGDMSDQINARETGETDHLVERIFKKDPGAKVFIYCGWAHATKNWQQIPGGKPVQWMAGRLQRATGIDPLCIDQTAMMEHSGPSFENSDYRFADASGKLVTDSVFETGPGKYFVGGWPQGRVDMQVFHPRTHYVQGRPDWLQAGTDRKPFPIQKAWLPSAGKALLQAFVASEPADAVPMDQVVVTPHSQNTALVLPGGKYRIMRQDEAGNSQFLETVTQP